MLQMFGKFNNFVIKSVFLGDFSFVKLFLKNYRVTMTTTLNTSRSEILWFCQHGDGFCMHVFSSIISKYSPSDYIFWPS